MKKTAILFLGYNMPVFTAAFDIMDSVFFEEWLEKYCTTNRDRHNYSVFCTLGAVFGYMTSMPYDRTLCVVNPVAAEGCIKGLVTRVGKNTCLYAASYPVHIHPPELPVDVFRKDYLKNTRNDTNPLHLQVGHIFRSDREHLESETEELNTYQAVFDRLIEDPTLPIGSVGWRLLTRIAGKNPECRGSLGVLALQNRKG